ncbi:unnamed protein product [Amoebophrya sp. A120]|nr:unnamed protein product [Amoebophrya sp. A120]|eukprot:GSA120T00008353001.1
MFTGVFLFGGFIFFSVYRHFVTYSSSLAGSWWAAYYLWFYLFLLLLFCVDLYHVYRYEIVEYDWLTATDKFGIGLLPEDEQKRYFLPNWLRLCSLTTPIFVILVFLISLVHTMQHHWHISAVLGKRWQHIVAERAKASGGAGAAPTFPQVVPEEGGEHEQGGDVGPPSTQLEDKNSQFYQDLQEYLNFHTKSSSDTEQHQVGGLEGISGKQEMKRKNVKKVDPYLEALFPHDLSIQVIALPCVYSMMAFKSVVRVWMMMTASTHNNNVADIESRKQQLMDYYESNYQLADLYEAWAIWCFSRLCVRQVKNISRQERWEGTAKRLFKPLSSITLLGVQTFVLVYGISCFYQLLLSVLKKTLSIDLEDIPVVGSGIETVATYINGAGFVASCLALYNIILFETQLHEWLDKFDPFWKFWGAKILVSLAFLQTFVLKLILVDVFGLLTVPQEMLFYSTLTTMECLPIAILHMKAWSHTSEWYTDPEWMLGSADASLHNSPRGSAAGTAEKPDSNARKISPGGARGPRVNLLETSSTGGTDHIRGSLVKPLLVENQ